MTRAIRISRLVVLPCTTCSSTLLVKNIVHNAEFIVVEEGKDGHIIEIVDALCSTHFKAEGYEEPPKCEE